MITTLFTILVGLLIASVGGYFAWKSYRRRQLRRALRQKRLHGDRDLSIFDVFWDLGANEFALEFLRQEGMLLAEPNELASAHQALSEVIDEHESYSLYLQQTREVIRDFSEQHDSLSSREVVPVLQSSDAKRLPTARQNPDVASAVDVKALERTRRGDSREPEGPQDRLGHLSTESVEVAAQFRRKNGSETARAAGLAPEDLDNITELSLGDILSGLLEGGLVKRLSRWWERRKLRDFKNELDSHFRALFGFYRRESQQTEDFHRPLYREADKWNREASRLRDLSRTFQKQRTGVETACFVLADDARQLAERVASTVRRQTDRVIREIDELGLHSDKPEMAGYLVYINRHALFVDKKSDPEYSRIVENVEKTLDRIQKEMRRLS